MPQVFQTNTVWILQILISGFLAILFLQSGLDKVFDWQGNKDYISAHFDRTPLYKFVPMMFPTITLLEVAAGVLSGVGALLLVFTKSTTLSFWGAVLSSVALLSLFFGQRVAKDYPGAGGLVHYFIVSIIAIWLLG